MAHILKTMFTKATQNVFILMTLFIVLFSLTTTVWAAWIADMSGWANTETVGDISFSCSDGGGYGNVCTGTNDYGVSYHENGGDHTDNYLQGYAWSPYVGWIRFANWTECPTDSTGATCRPRVDHANGEILGWARACGGITSNLDGCSTTGSLQNADSGGWDGWISLSSRNENASWDPRDTNRYGWVVDPVDPNGSISGYAWGGGGDNQVIGWLQAGSDLNLGTPLIPNPPVLTLDIFDMDNGGVQLSDGDLVAAGANLELRWTITPNHPSTSCTATNFVLPADPQTDTDAVVIAPGPDTTRTYTLSCENDGDPGNPTIVDISIRVPALPLVALFPLINGSDVTALLENLGPNPEDRVLVIGETDNVGFNWSATGEPGDTISCVPEGPGFNVGSPSTSGPDTDVTEPVVGSQQDFVIRCTGLGGTTPSHVLVRYPAPEVQLWTIPRQVDLTASAANREVEVFWDVTGYNDTMCRLTGTGIPGSPVSLAGSDLPTGSFSNIVINGETDFGLECDPGPVPAVQPGGLDDATVTVSGQLTED